MPYYVVVHGGGITYARRQVLGRHVAKEICNIRRTKVCGPYVVICLGATLHEESRLVWGSDMCKPLYVVGLIHLKQFQGLYLMEPPICLSRHLHLNSK